MAGDKKEPTIQELMAELEAARSAKSEAEAQAKIMADSLAAIREQEFAAVVDRHVQAGRVAPAMREETIKVAKNFGTPAKLDAFLATLPSHVKSAAAAGKQVQQEIKDEPKAFQVKDPLSADGVVPDAERKSFERQFKTQIEKTGAFSSITFGDDGVARAVDREGNALATYDKFGKPIAS